jgi:hypothetical protein
MRLWSIHPQYLDGVGLTALWREALLAQKVLQGLTQGYRHHPQLTRFRRQPDPLAAIGAYLGYVHEEAQRRCYHFDGSKIGAYDGVVTMAVTAGQLRYEWEHLQRKLAVRDNARHRMLQGVTNPEPHPLFRVVEGEVEDWEVGRRWSS